MKTTIHFSAIVLSIVLTMTIASAYSQSTDQAGKNKNEIKNKDTLMDKAPHSVNAVFYTCPSHPKVKSDRPGNCAQCGLTMNKKKEKVYYACPKHTEVQHDDKGECEKCGVVLQQKE